MCGIGCYSVTFGCLTGYWKCSTLINCATYTSQSNCEAVGCTWNAGGIVTTQSDIYTDDNTDTECYTDDDTDTNTYQGSDGSYHIDQYIGGALQSENWLTDAGFWVTESGFYTSGGGFYADDNEIDGVEIYGSYYYTTGGSLYIDDSSMYWDDGNAGFYMDSSGGYFDYIGPYGYTDSVNFIGWGTAGPLVVIDNSWNNDDIVNLELVSASGQTANMTEWKNSSGYTLASINNAGEIRLPQINDAATPTISFGDGDTGIYEASDDQIYISTANEPIMLIAGSGVYGLANGQFALRDVTGTTTTPTYSFIGDYKTGFSMPVAGNISIIANSTEIVKVNGSGATIKSGYLYEENKIHAFGGFQSQSSIIDLTQNVWANVSNASRNLWSGEESDGIEFANDCLVFSYTADYVGSLALSYGGTTSTNYRFRIRDYNNTITVGYEIGHTGTGATNFNTISLPVYINATKGNYYCLQVVNEDNNNDITLKDAVFEVHYLHN